MVTGLYARRGHAAPIERIDAHYQRKGARMYKKAIIASTAIALSIGAGIVRAQSVEGPWYGGIDLGRSRLGLGGSDFDNALANQGIGASSSNDRGDTSLGFNVGYLVNSRATQKAASLFEPLDSLQSSEPIEAFGRRVYRRGER